MNRGIRGIHPAVLISYITIILIGLMVFRELMFLIVGLLSLIINFYAIEEEDTLKQSAKGLLIMSVIIIILNPIFNRRGSTVLFYFYNNPVTLESTIIGIKNALSLSALLFLFMLLNKILTMDGLLYIMTKMSKRWAMLIMVSLNFVPALKNKIQNMQEVQRTKKVVVDNEKPIQAAKTGMTFVQALLNQSLEDSMIAADSMTARGYGSSNRTSYQQYQFYPIDWLMLIALSAGFILLLIQRDNVIALIIWATMCLMPTVIEGKEQVKWLFYQ